MLTSNHHDDPHHGVPLEPLQPAQPDTSSSEPEKKKRDKGAFKFKYFTIRHDLCGMKVGTDAVLLTGYPHNNTLHSLHSHLHFPS